MKHQGAFIPQLLESGEPLLDLLSVHDHGEFSEKILEMATFMQAQAVLSARGRGRAILVIKDPITRSERLDLLKSLKVLAEELVNTLPGNWLVDARDRSDKGGMMALYLFKQETS